MTSEELKALSKEEIKEYITGIWSEGRLWDGTASNAYVSVEVLGASLDEVKEALATLAKDYENEEVIEMLGKDILSLHENYLEENGRIIMAYWKGSLDFAYTLSKVLPNMLVICNDDGWYGVDECIIAKNGEDAKPGVDYEGNMQYCLNDEFEAETYYEVELQIIDTKGNMTYVGGGMISEEDTKNYKKWASYVEKVREINWDRDSKKLSKSR